MVPNTIVEHDKSGLEMVIDAMDKLVEERFIEGIRSKHRTLYEIAQTTEMVEMYQRRVNIEARALTRFSENFIRQFATDNNKCFDTAERLFRKIRSTIAGLKQIFHKMTPIDRNRLPEEVEVPSVFDKSPLGHGDYTADAFGLESFPQEVQDLYHALDTLFSTSATMLALCHLMIEEEERTRNDIVQLRQIYRTSCEELLGAVRAASVFVAPVQELPHNELEERRKRAGSEDSEKFLKEGYHTVDKGVMTQYLIIRTIREARNEGLTEKEAYFWRKDHDKALRVRRAIEQFDQLSDVEGQRGSLSSHVVVEFLKWCGVPESQEKMLYKEYFVPNYTPKGKYKPLAWTTVSDVRKQHRDVGGSDEELARSFEQRLSNILEQKDETDSKTIALGRTA